MLGMMLFTNYHQSNNYQNNHHNNYDNSNWWEWYWICYGCW